MDLLVKAGAGESKNNTLGMKCSWAERQNDKEETENKAKM